MRQVSISISDLSFKILIYLTEISGKSQSAICAPYIEKGLANEMRELKLQLDLLEEIKGGSEDNSGKTKTQK